MTDMTEISNPDNRHTEEDYICYKELTLITPKKSQELGIPGETPLLISPRIITSYIEGRTICEVCGVKFTPLIYQAGYTTLSQHFHQTLGGIYWYQGNE